MVCAGESIQNKFLIFVVFTDYTYLLAFGSFVEQVNTNILFLNMEYIHNDKRKLVEMIFFKL